MKRCLLLVFVTVIVFAAGVRAESLLEMKDLRSTVSLGIGTAFPFNPDGFDRDFNQSFGVLLDVGAGVKYIELGATFDYSFFLSNTTKPDDANVLNTFLTVRLKPLETKARPYLLATGGYYRYWIVDRGPTENVLGYGAGAGVEVEVDKSRRVFLEGRYIIGRTRESTPENPLRANTESISVRFGLTWAIQTNTDK